MKVKATADEILAINQDTMVRKSDAVRRQAERMNAVTITVALAALVLGLFVSTLLTRRMLHPLAVLGAATHRLGEGDFDTRARVHGNDELAQLARDFNAMAVRLADYRKSSLGELLQAQLAMQAAIDSLPDPVVIFGLNGELQNINLAAETLLGLKTEMSPRDPLKSVDPAVRAVLERMRSHILGGKGAYIPRGFEHAVQLPTLLGDRFFLPRAAPVHERRGVIMAATVMLQDVTRLRRFEELKDDLVATVAHEIRTPLTSLRMAIHILNDQVVGPLTEKQGTLLSAAREDCERLQALVDDVLDLSRIESGHAEMHPIPTSASALIEAAIETHQAAAGERHVQLIVVPPVVEERVLVDRDRIQHVFSNLLTNAIRHTQSNGSIRVSSRLTNGSVRFEVADTGEGIPQEHQQRIFEKFYRVPGSTSGTAGLGLSIAKEVVKGHGGEIGVESEPGRGSTFWFTVPTAMKSDSKGERR